MIVIVSIDKEFDNYTELASCLNQIASSENFREFSSLDHPLLQRYLKEFNKPIQFFKIEWGNIKGAPNVKTNKFGKPYDADAPIAAAKKILDYSSHCVEFGKGNYNISQCLKDKDITMINLPKEVKNANKRYRF